MDSERTQNRKTAIQRTERALLTVLKSVTGTNADDDMKRASAAFRLAAIRKELLREEGEA